MRWLVGVLIAFSGLAFAPQPAAGEAPLKIVVLVVDGLRPSDVSTAVTPFLSELKDASTWYEESRSVMIAETIPNHVAMMTGVYPDRSGIVANSYWNRKGNPAGRDLSDPAELDAETLFTTLRQRCPSLRTASVLSKEYLNAIFSKGGINEAPHDQWKPPNDTYVIPGDFTPLPFIYTEITSRLATSDFMFINIGDIDRAGHVDATGLGLGEGGVRTGAYIETDLLLRQMVGSLQSAPEWDRTVLFVLSDHGFDFSVATNTVPTGDLAGPDFLSIVNGGVDSLYLTKPDPTGRLRRSARARLLAHPGVERVWYREANPADPDPDSLIPSSLHMSHENGGDLVMLARTGWRGESPIPGNHGHLVTTHGTFMVTGGAPFLAPPRVVAPSAALPAPPDTDRYLVALPEQSEAVDVAPTVAWLLGLPTDRYDGRVLREAFTVDASPTVCAAAAGPATPVAPPRERPDGTATGTGALPATGEGIELAIVAVAAITVVVIARRRSRRN